MGSLCRRLVWAVLLFPFIGLAQPYQALIEQGHFLRARVQVEDVLKKNPRDQAALIAKSALEMQFNQLDASVATAEAAVAAGDQSAASHAQLAGAVGWRIASSSASLLQKVKSAWRFRKEVDRALQLDPNNVDALTYMAEYDWYVPGIAGGSKKKAQEIADKIVSLDPVKGYDLKSNFAGEEADKIGRSDALELIWKQAVAARPSAYNAHVSLGYVYFNDTRGASRDSQKRKLAGRLLWTPGGLADTGCWR